MAAAITATSVAEPLVPVTVAGTGFSATTDYVVRMTDPQGHTGYKSIKSDGSGAFSYVIVPQTVGTYTFDARPLAETTGTTTPAATVSGKVKR